MNVLHITPHLGGGVGKAHATLAEAAAARPGPAPRRRYALLEPQIDVRYTDRIAAAGWPVSVVDDLDCLAALVRKADVVQVEWWNHPLLYNALVSNRLPALRLITWMHISGLAAPLIPRALVDLAHSTLFSSPCSFNAANLRDSICDRPDAFNHVNSGFGFKDVRHRARSRGTPLRFGYLGTLNFLKLHPEFFDFVDAVDADIRVHLWGRHDLGGEVARRAMSMRSPHRIVFEDHTNDPAAVLAQLDVFIYLLASDHYGTAENALLEAMSAGAVPIIFANSAEMHIVEDQSTGFVVRSQDEFVRCMQAILENPSRLKSMRLEARKKAGSYRPDVSLARLETVYDGAMRQPKRRHDFAAALGTNARSWFLSSLSPSMSEQEMDVRFFSNMKSKGSIEHFRSCFPHDQELASLQVRNESVSLSR